MSNCPEDVCYTKDHEWLRVDGEKATIGITDHAQNQLGDVVYVELPKVKDHFNIREPFGTVESVKAMSEIYMPVSGTVLEANQALNDSDVEVNPINSDPYGQGWMIVIKMDDPLQVDALLNSAEYEDFIKDKE